MTYEPKHLLRWTLPDHYAGEVWPNYYVFLTRHRDSDILTNSNFECALRHIGGEQGEDVLIVREGHWAVGWVEWIAIHQDAAEALEKADGVVDALADYPVWDEQDFAEREYEAMIEYWNGWGTSSVDYRHRLNLIKDWNERTTTERVPFLAARHDLETIAERYDYFEQWIADCAGAS